MTQHLLPLAQRIKDIQRISPKDFENISTMKHSKAFVRLAHLCGTTPEKRRNELEKILRTLPGDEELAKKIQRLRALSDPLRIKIVYLLTSRSMCVCELTSVFKVSQPTISHHIKILKQAGLVTARRHEKWIFYKLRRRLKRFL